KPLLKPIFVNKDDRYLALLSAKGRFLIISLTEVRKLAGGGLGTILMGLDEDDKLSQAVPFGETGLAVTGIYRRKETVDILDLNELEQYIGKRARKGRVLDVRVKDFVLSRPSALDEE